MAVLILIEILNGPIVNFECPYYIGGGKGSTIFCGVELMPYTYQGSHIKNEYSYWYIGHVTKSLLEYINHDKINIICRIPLVYS